MIQLHLPPIPATQGDHDPEQPLGAGCPAHVHVPNRHGTPTTLWCTRRPHSSISQHEAAIAPEADTGSPVIIATWDYNDSCTENRRTTP